MVNFISLLLVAISMALTPEQWRLMHRDGTVEAVAGRFRLDPASRAGLVAGWTWTERRAPRRLLAERIGRDRLPDDDARLAVAVIRREAGQKSPADLRLIAAPTEMWIEVPEALLPSWPVPKDGKLSIPIESGRAWRLRVAGRREGTWWVNVGPGRRSVSLLAVPASDIDLSVLDPGGRPAAALDGFLQEPSGRGGSLRPWERVSRDKGRVEVLGLPDEAEVSLTLFEAGTAPLVLRGRPSALPRQVRLSAGAELAGRLVDTRGRPVPNVALSAEAFTSDTLPQLLTSGTRSGPQGEWNLGGLPPGKVAWSASLPGYLPLAETLDVEGGVRQDVGTRTLVPGQTVAVDVADEAGVKVAGARVQALAGKLEAVADASGVAWLSGLPQAPLEVTGSAPGHLDGRAVLNPPFSSPSQLILH
nr:carboxypeptidase-like regulatory domain-containing protein [Acidobacteriota bacterium]